MLYLHKLLFSFVYNDRMFVSSFDLIIAGFVSCKLGLFFFLFKLRWRPIYLIQFRLNQALLDCLLVGNAFLIFYILLSRNSIMQWKVHLVNYFSFGLCRYSRRGEFNPSVHHWQEIVMPNYHVVKKSCGSGNGLLLSAGHRVVSEKTWDWTQSSYKVRV